MYNLLESMKNKNHGWTKPTEHDCNVLKDLINQFIYTDDLKCINFDDVAKEYDVNISCDIILKVLEKMGFDNDFDGDNGWEYDCWYKCSRNDVNLTLEVTCISNNVSLYKEECSNG